ncbi:DnaA/Hda family protein, partial [Cutibacterium acnes]
NAFVVEHVRERYLARIRELLAYFAGTPEVSLEIGALPKAAPPPPARREPDAFARTLAPIDDGFQTHLDPHYTFDNFVEGRSNQLGRAAALQAAQKPGDRAHNPLLLYGGTGLGKTHLMFAAGNAMRAANPGMRVLYLRSEQFFSAMMKALQDKAMDQFKRQFQQVEALLIDDIQFFAGKDRTQEEFFNAFEALLAKRAHIIMTSDTYPKGLVDIDERLTSRFDSGLTVAIEPPELEMRVAIL